MRISDWSSDVCSSDLKHRLLTVARQPSRDGLAPSRRALAGAPPGEAFPFLPHAEPAQPASRSMLPHRCRQIGRASGRERVCQYGLISVVDVSLKKKNTK